MQKLSQSAQDYLKVLLELQRTKSEIHTKDVAHELNYSLPSISQAMNSLKERGYISKEKYGTISLTESGVKVATVVKKRNHLITLFLINILGVSSEHARVDACGMEHHISPETADKLEEYLSDKQLSM